MLFTFIYEEVTKEAKSINIDYEIITCLRYLVIVIMIFLGHG